MVALVLLAVAVTSAIFVSTVEPPQVRSHLVGDYSGISIEQVRATAETNDWVLDEDQVRTDEAEFGTVISQSPGAGAVLGEGELLNVDVASGPRLVTLPQVEGLPLSDAVNLLEREGFQVGLITTLFDENVPDDHVISLAAETPGTPEDDSAELLFEPDTVVQLTVSSGPLPDGESQ